MCATVNGNSGSVAFYNGTSLIASGSSGGNAYIGKLELGG